MGEVLADVLRAYRKRALFTSHALDQMNLQERMISPHEVYEAIESDEIVEDYPNDPRGHTCLIMGKTRVGRVIHLVCAPKTDYLAIITAYVPSLIEWELEFRRRKRK